MATHPPQTGPKDSPSGSQVCSNKFWSMNRKSELEMVKIWKIRFYHAFKWETWMSETSFQFFHGRGTDLGVLLYHRKGEYYYQLKTIQLLGRAPGVFHSEGDV